MCLMDSQYSQTSRFDVCRGGGEHTAGLACQTARLDRLDITDE